MVNPLVRIIRFVVDLVFDVIEGRANSKPIAKAPPIEHPRSGYTNGAAVDPVDEDTKPDRVSNTGERRKPKFPA